MRLHTFISRLFLVAPLAVGLLFTACKRNQPPTPSESGLEGRGASWKEFDFAPGKTNPEGQRAIVLQNPNASDLPLLVALHGRGESGRGLDLGAKAWRDSYHLDKMYNRLLHPPLLTKDLGEITSLERLKLLNASLKKDDFQGLTLVCPYTPDLMSDKSPEALSDFADFVVSELLPKARSLVGSKAGPEKTGIDGVSLGGRLALLVGLSRPEAFGSVGALQPAIRQGEIGMFATMAKQAMDKHPFALRLVSSEADPFLPAVRALSDRLRQDGVVHELLVVAGHHDYDWNRGPGGAEMLLWHERVLRGIRPP